MNKHLKNILIILLFSIIIEVFVCNFNHFKSINYKSYKYDNITVLKDKNDNKYIEIKKINKHLKNIVLNIDIPKEKKYIDYDIYVTDEAYYSYLKLPTRHLYKYIEKSKYVTLNLSGKCNKLKVVFVDSKDYDINVKNIEFNKTTPFDYSITRQLLIFLIISFIYIFRPNSELYKYKYNPKSIIQKIVIITLFISEIFVMWYAVNANEIIKHLEGYSNQMQYYDLTEALTKKQVYLDRKPSEELKNMKNPYDYITRQKLVEEKNADFAWDMAYYKGKYYVYFGIVPVITAYLPVYLITKEHIANYILVFIISVLTMFGMYLFVKELVKRYFKETKFLVFLLILGWLFNTSGLLGILGYATIYNVPIVYAIMFIFYGLYFWISSINDNKISSIRIFFGSMCMALVAGCRPHLLLSSFFAIPIFYKSVFKDRTLFSKKSIKQTIMFIIPYIIVAIPLMYYNYIRFGSITDFGSNYNITSNDITRRGFVFGRIGLGLYTLLFQLPNYKAVFPFLISNSFATNYMGMTVYECIFGGVFVTNVLLLLSLVVRWFKEKIPKELYVICIMTIIMTLIITILDVEVGGILTRYILDFKWLLCISTLIIILSVLNIKRFDKIKKIFIEICLILIVLSLIYEFTYLFDDKLLHDMINSSTDFYFKWYYLVQFWL